MAKANTSTFTQAYVRPRISVLDDHFELFLRCGGMNDNEVDKFLRAVERHELQAVGIYIEENNYRIAEVEFAVDWVLHEEMTRISGNMFDTDRCGWKDGTAPEAYVAVTRLVQAAKEKKQNLKSWIRVSQHVRESPNLHKQVCQELGYAYGRSASPWKVPPEEHGRSILGLEEAKVIRREVR